MRPLRDGAAADYRIRSQPMRDIPARLRPREQFELMGAEHVPDQTLLALIVRVGVPGVNVADLAAQMLRDFGSLTALAQASVAELTQYDGIGKVKAQMLKAALELGRRLSLEAVPEHHKIASPEDVLMVLRERVRLAQTELFWVLLLDTKNRLTQAPIEVSKGTLNATLAHPREIFKEAIRASAASLILSHNHPSGDPTPSPEDIKITRQLVDAGKIVGIRLLDHIIIGRQREEQRLEHISLRESGIVQFPD
jgi:DNA repair protein RadC